MLFGHSLVERILCYGAVVVAYVWYDSYLVVHYTHSN